MRYLPPRRWFQFHLSTWFVLVAILALLARDIPWLVLQYRMWNPKPVQARWQKVFHELAAIERNHDKVRNPDDIPVGWSDQDRLVALPHKHRLDALPLKRWEIPHLALPSLALAAFLTWKAAWALGERRRRQLAAHCRPLTGPKAI